MIHDENLEILGERWIKNKEALGLNIKVEMGKSEKRALRIIPIKCPEDYADAVMSFLREIIDATSKYTSNALSSCLPSPKDDDEAKQHKVMLADMHQSIVVEAINCFLEYGVYMFYSEVLQFQQIFSLRLKLLELEAKK